MVLCMATIPLKRYVDGIYKKFGYRATWLPGTALRLGDVWIANLKDLGIRFDTRVG